MINIIWGILIGFVLNFFPFWQLETGFEIYPQWHGKIDSIGNIEKSKAPGLDSIRIPPIKTPSEVFILSGSGNQLYNIGIKDSLISISGNGKFLVKYEKVGTSIEFLDIQGVRFWKIGSMEYPFLSYNGKIIILMNGDHSRIRIIDYHGNETGIGKIIGRFCTVLSFSKYSDYVCAGFLDGRYYLINERGEVINRGVVSDNSYVKGMAVNSGGNLLAIHYGNNKKDFVKLVNLQKSGIYKIPLRNVHLTKTAINISHRGKISIIDYNRILLIGEDGRIENNIKIFPKRVGASNIDFANGVYVASYSKIDGGSQFLVFRDDGILIFAKEFPGESFLSSSIEGSIMFLRGSQNLFCYSYYYQ